MNKKLLNQKKQKEFRKHLRNNMPKPEQKLWYYIRNKQIQNLKFRRQVSIEKYVVDFLCFEKKLIIEIDGDSHYTETGITHDKKRTEFLEAQGFTILRFTNLEVMQNTEGCFWKLTETLKTL